MKALHITALVKLLTSLNLTVAALLLLAGTAVAQGAGPGGSGFAGSGVDKLTETARELGVRIIVLEPEPTTDEANGQGFSVIEGVETVETSFRSLLIGAGHDLAAFDERLSLQWPQSHWISLFSSIALALTCLAAAFVAERWIMRRLVGPQPKPANLTVAGRHRLRLRTAAVSGTGLVLGLLIAAILFLSITERNSPERDVGYAVLLMGALYMRIGFVLIDVALCGGRGSPGLERSVHEGRALSVWLGITVALISLLQRLDLGLDLLRAMRLVMAMVFIALLASVLWRNRRALGAGVLPEGTSSLLRAAISGLTAIYLVTALALFALDVLVGIGITGRAVLAPIYWGAAALIFHSALIVLRDLRAHREAELIAAANHEGVTLAVAPDGASTAGEANHSDEHKDAKEAHPTSVLSRQGAVVASESALTFWIGAIAWSWGVPLLAASGSIHPFWTIFLVVFLARLGWVLIDGLFARRLAEEGRVRGPAEPADEGGAAGSRLGTLLPLMRSFLLITVVVVTSMIVLSKLGVDIAPLFAGAGLVGLAVGFGAQSLVRDVFSGLFFLIDDAFRQGEYVETGGLRGTVEKISIRSMQIRHQTGPLHTIPFGEITHLTNFSRDWVIMKLPLRVTFDTDPERVRKLVKKLGQELLQDPVIGDKFIEPLKSQGVREIDDSGQIIRVKFMTRPGEQFMLRKEIYARIREIFEREGIEFARKEVRVRVSGGDHQADQELEQIAGAAAERATEHPAAKA